MPRLLMAPPDFYGIEYEINPWMSRSRPASRTTARRQWRGLRRILTEQLGGEVLEVEPRQGLPDLVFTANAGLVVGQRAILSNFRHPERQAEAPVFRQWFEANGFTVDVLPQERHFEGEGDALFVGDTLFAGYHFRSDVHSHRLIGELLDVRVISLQLVDPWYYHLDTCLCPLNADTVAYYPPAFDDYARRAIEVHVPNRVDLHPDEAQRFAANAVVIGKNVALNAGCPRFEAALRDLGFTPHPTPLDEFQKAGGSAKCLTLHLDRP